MQQTPEIWLIQGRQYLQAKNYAEALRCFDQAIALNPNFADAWNGRGAALRNLQELQKALEAYDRSLELNPNSDKAWFNKGLLMEQWSNLAAARYCYGKTLSINPDLADVRRRYQALQPENLVTQPTAKLEQTNLNDAEAWFDRGNQQAMAGVFQGAIASYDQALYYKPDYHEAWFNRGNALSDLGRNEEAIASFDQAIHYKPDFYEAWSNRGNALSDLGRNEEAIASFDQALYYKPDLHEAWSNRGEALRYLGRYEEAIASFDQALYYKPDLHEVWNNRGGVLSALERNEEAIASFDQGIHYKPDKHEAWFNRGAALSALRRNEEAIASFDQALYYKLDKHEAWNNRGVALSALRRNEEAIASFDQALHYKPDLHEAWLNRGVAAGNSVQTPCFESQALPIVQQNSDLNQRGYFGELACYEVGLQYIHQDTHPEGWGLLHQAIGKAHYFRGRFDRPSHYLPQAIHSLNTALQTLTPETFPEEHLETIRFLIRANLGLGNTDEAKHLRIHGLAVFGQLLNATPSPTRKRQLSIDFITFRQVIIDSLVQSGKSLAAIEAAERDKNLALLWILEGWQEDTVSPSYVEMRSLLNDHTAAISWHLSPDALTPFILKANSEKPIVLSTHTRTQYQAFTTWLKEWDQDYQDYRKKKESETPEERSQHSWRKELQTRLDRLKDILQISQLEAELKGIDRLILLPHRDLHRFPIHALFDRRFTITYLPSLQIGLSLQERANPTAAQFDRQQSSLLSIIAPASQDLPGLPFAELEAAVIQQFFSTVTSIEPHAATQATLIDQLQRNHTIFHFSGHASFDDRQPQNSALALTGTEHLTAQTLNSLNLSDIAIACLAACETSLTGNPSIEMEYVGIVSALLKAGVSTVVSTLWTVEDAANAWLMIRFYQYLLFDQKTPAIALKTAQDWLRSLTPATLIGWLQELLPLLPANSGARAALESQIRNLHKKSDKINLLYDDPYYWAAFTLAGQIC